jgi:transcriptional regulator with XRE-family HTH domain
MTIEPLYKSLGVRLKHLREMNGLTQDEVGKKLGMVRCAVANMEAGKQRIMMHHIPTMAQLFRVSPEALVKGIW